MLNTPKVRLGIIAISRKNYDIQLATKRRQKVVNCLIEEGLNIVECSTTVVNEKDAIKALNDIKGINALIIYQANFGAEGPATLIAKKFNGPVMFVGAAEESSNELMDKRCDAYCGMLSIGYNISLRGINPYIPHYPIGTPEEVAKMILEFYDIARIYIGVKRLKIISLGPRPQDFFSINSPIKPLFDLGIEIEENSELDLYSSYKEHLDDPRINEVIEEMQIELKDNNNYPEVLHKLAAYELTLLDWYLEHRGSCKFAIFAIKCWPAFQKEFGFVPCYINSRLARKGIPIACEADIYGALSEFMLQLATKSPVTILDINNNIPKDLYDKYNINYSIKDLFMGFHCGNTSTTLMKNYKLNYHKIMHKILESDQEPEITRGTLEGTIAPSDVTIFRLMANADGKLQSYIAEGEILDLDPETFGSSGIFAIPEMARFYRYVLIEKNFPHHTGVGFKHVGKLLFEALKLMGIEDISFNRDKNQLYPKENYFI